MPPEPFAVYHVPENAPAAAELMGTKPKFWFSRDGVMWLFKASRAGTGEHWAEVISGATQGIESAIDVFGGYLLLDAWVGNTDRHHENWGLVVHPSQGDRHLAPTFDHASSLGCHLRDEQRQRRLDSHDPGFRVEGFVQRADARSALYRQAGDTQPLTMLAAYVEWAEASHCEPWVRRLAEIADDEIATAIRLVPESEMTGPARAFAQAMLSVNRERILRGR